MSVLDATSGDELREPVITDVWSRTAAKYRVRAVVLLLVDMVLFAGLGCFAFWLRTGQLFAPATEDYWGLLGRTFMPRGDATLANFVVFPISLDAVPAHGVVVGLLLAALVSIPILIAILYRLPSSLPFILVVAFLAVMPWLAINLTGACILATIRPLRFRFRYASALLGLLLVMLYFYGASRETAPFVDMHKPEDRIKFMAPWILATLASCLIMGGVLFLARVVNYRPGVVAPLLLVSFAVPVVLFERYVGRDELYYRLLERTYQSEFGLHEHHVDRDVSEWFDALAQARWEAEPEPRPPYDVVRDRVEFRLGLELAAELDQRSAFSAQRDELVAAADHFIRFFPDSRYAPNALYLKAEALDLRIDLNAFLDRKVIRYYDDFPAAQSDIVWRRVVANAPAPGSDIAAVGRYRLAMFAARGGRLDEALALLDELLALYAGNGVAAPAGVAGLVTKVLRPKPADASLQLSRDLIVSEARQFRALLVNNGRDPAYGMRPFSGSEPGEPRQPGLMQLDPGHVHYEDNLASIVRAYPRCLLEDNIVLRQALATRNLDEKIARLEGVIAKYPKGDARPEALFLLGAAYLESNATERGRARLEQLVQEYPNETLWTPLARDRLRRLPAAIAVEAGT